MKREGWVKELLKEVCYNWILLKLYFFNFLLAQDHSVDVYWTGIRKIKKIPIKRKYKSPDGSKNQHLAPMLKFSCKPIEEFDTERVTCDNCHEVECRGGYAKCDDNWENL